MGKKFQGHCHSQYKFGLKNVKVDGLKCTFKHVRKIAEKSFKYYTRKLS